MLTAAGSACPRLLTIMAAMVVLAVGAVPARGDKCSGAKLKAIGKKEAGLLTCQANVAAKNDTSGLMACESKVKGKFSTAFGKAGACVANETTCEDIADACDSAVAAFLTDTFPSKCEAAKRKAAGKLTSRELGCYAKAASKGAALDTGCITKARVKFGTALTKAGTCPDAGSPQAVIEQDCVQRAVTTNGGGMVAAVCPTTATTTSSTTTTTTATTTTTLPACGNSIFPTCGGTCQVGEVCQAITIASGEGTPEIQACACVQTNAVCSVCSQGPCPATYPICITQLIPSVACAGACCNPIGSTCTTDADCCSGVGFAACDATFHTCQLLPLT
jgi:hypothetical protein